MNKVVARFSDGRMVKGTTLDFGPDKELFHVSESSMPLEVAPVPIRAMDLKALFFVKDFAGDSLHIERREFSTAPPSEARQISAEFNDGEVLVGTTADYRPGLPGFFVVPADAGSNNERCFVLTTATRQVHLL